MSHPENQKDTNQKTEGKPSGVHGRLPTRRIREGKTRGGVNEAPTTPRTSMLQESFTRYSTSGPPFDY